MAITTITGISDLCSWFAGKNNSIITVVNTKKNCNFFCDNTTRPKTWAIGFIGNEYTTYKTISVNKPTVLDGVIKIISAEISGEDVIFTLKCAVHNGTTYSNIEKTVNLSIAEDFEDDVFICNDGENSELDFKYGTQWASSVGIQMQESFSFSEIKPKIETFSIPARNGDLHYYDGSFENRTATVKCFVLAENAGEAMTKINAFLFANYNGYYKDLVVSDDMKHKWLAQMISCSDMKLRLGRLNAFEIKLTCYPYRINVDTGAEEL